MELTEKELKLKQKVQKDFPEFIDVVEHMDLDDLEKKLLGYAKHREETLQFQAKDEALHMAKERVAELNGPYKDTLGALKQKCAYIHLLMAEIKQKNG